MFHVSTTLSATVDGLCSRLVSWVFCCNHLTEIGVWKCRAEETGLGHDSSPNATTAGSQLATAGERGVHHSTPDSWRLSMTW